MFAFIKCRLAEKDDCSAPITPFITTDIFAVSIIAFFVIILGYYCMIPEVCGIFHDDGIYVINAKALATGQGYRLINLPEDPIQTKYPILYPAFLAIIWKLYPEFPQNVTIMKISTLIISAIATCIFYLYMVHFKYFQRYIAFSACLIASSLSISIFFSNNILSEFPFAFLTLIALWSIDSLIIHDTSNKGHLFLVGFLSSLPFLCRTIGGVLLPLLFLLLLWRKRPVAWMTFGAAIIVVPWMLWCTFGNNSNNDNIMEFYTSYSSWWLHSTDINALWKIIFYNLIFILMSVPQLSGIYDVFKYIFSTYYYIYLIPFGIMAFTIIIYQSYQIKIMPLFLLAYFAILCFWPWPPIRFLLPFAPYIISSLILFMFQMNATIFKIHKLNYAIYLILAAIIMFNLYTSQNIAAISKKHNYPYGYMPKHQVSWSKYQELFEWINTNSNINDILGSGHDSVFYLYTSRNTLRPFAHYPLSMFYGADRPPIGTAEDLVSAIRKYNIRYLIHTPLPGFPEERPFADLISQVQQDCPGWLNPVFVGRDRRFIIFSVQGNQGGL